MSQNRTKYCNKQTNNKQPFFLPKINKVFLTSEPNFTKSEGKIRFGQFFLKMILLTSQKRCHQPEFLSFQEVGQKRKMVIKSERGVNRIYPSLTLQTAKCFPLKGVLKTIFNLLCALRTLFSVLLLGIPILSRPNSNKT